MTLYLELIVLLVCCCTSSYTKGQAFVATNLNSLFTVRSIIVTPANTRHVLDKVDVVVEGLEEPSLVFSFYQSKDYSVLKKFVELNFK